MGKIERQKRQKSMENAKCKMQNGKCKIENAKCENGKCEK